MKSKSKGKDFCIFALPGLFCFVAVLIIPFLYGVYLTLTDWNGVSREKNFVGLTNFAAVMRDGQFWSSLLLTFRYVIFVVVIVNVLAFGIAWLLTRGIRGQNFFRAGFFTPNLIGGIVLGYIWQVIINGVLAFARTTLTAGAKYGFWGMVVAMNWQMIGYMMIIYIAGIQNVSEDVKEAAMIDGVSKFQMLRKIILPLIMPSITICMFMTITNSFKMFDLNLALTAGLPGKSTSMITLDIYNSFYNRMGYEGVGQAKAVVFFFILAAISVTQLMLTRKREVEN